LPSALIIGAACGLLGAAYVAANTYVNMFRKDYFAQPLIRVFEVVVLAFVTTSFAYWLPYTVQATCFPVSTSTE